MSGQARWETGKTGSPWPTTSGSSGQSAPDWKTPRCTSATNWTKRWSPRGSRPPAASFRPQPRSSGQWCCSVVSCLCSDGCPAKGLRWKMRRKDSYSSPLPLSPVMLLVEEPADSIHTPLLLLPRGINEVLEESWKFRGWRVGGESTESRWLWDKIWIPAWKTPGSALTPQCVRGGRIHVALKQDINTIYVQLSSYLTRKQQNPRGFKARH